MSGYTVPDDPTDAELLHAWRTYTDPSDPGLSGPTVWTLTIARRFHNLGPETKPECAAAYKRLGRVLASEAAR